MLEPSRRDRRRTRRPALLRRDSALRATAMDTETGERLVLGPGQRVGGPRVRCELSGFQESSSGQGARTQAHGWRVRIRDERDLVGSRASGCDLAREATPPSWMVSEIAELERNGTHAHAVLPNTAALEAASDDLLDPAVAPDAAGRPSAGAARRPRRRDLGQLGSNASGHRLLGMDEGLPDDRGPGGAFPGTSG